MVGTKTYTWNEKAEVWCGGGGRQASSYIYNRGHSPRESRPSCAVLQFESPRSLPLDIETPRLGMYFDLFYSATGPGMAVLDTGPGSSIPPVYLQNHLHSPPPKRPPRLMVIL